MWQLITMEHDDTGLAKVDYGIVSTMKQNRCGICSHVGSEWKNYLYIKNIFKKKAK